MGPFSKQIKFPCVFRASLSLDNTTYTTFLWIFTTITKDEHRTLFVFIMIIIMILIIYIYIYVLN